MKLYFDNKIQINDFTAPHFQNLTNGLINLKRNAFSSILQKFTSKIQL